MITTVRPTGIYGYRSLIMVFRMTEKHGHPTKFLVDIYNLQNAMLNKGNT